jgi:hypothetical protein
MIWIKEANVDVYEGRLSIELSDSQLDERTTQKAQKSLQTFNSRKRF